MSEARGFQYETAAHEADTAIAGMWLFLASETLFFGGLIFVWLVLDLRDPAGLRLGVAHSNLTIGSINTAVLITSSLVLTVGVRGARAGSFRRTVQACLITAGLGALFVGLKGVEWWKDIGEGLYPGPGFPLPGAGARLFWGWYWVATVLHAAHMLGGIGLVLWVAWRARRGHFSRAYWTPVEVVGLYWSFVDVVWLVLYADLLGGAAMIRLALAWVALMLLLGIEVIGTASGAGWLAWFAAPVMIALVACVFMHVTRASALSRIFAITGLFWVAVLLGLGSADYLSRRVTPAPALTAPFRP
jgi:cytochrome c oxidase subunit 3